MNRILICLLLAAAMAIPCLADDLSKLHELRNYTSERAGSYDRTGANDDGNWGNPVKAGETRTLAELTGPGIIKHFWTTIATNEQYHLKRIVIRMYWDGQSRPAVEAPIGDFFGLGLGEYYLWNSGPLSVGSQKALNSFFPMPFRKSARITVTNEGEQDIRGFYFNFDWEKHKSLPDDIAYFHAEYRQAVPNDGWTGDWTRNGEDKVNKHKNPVGKGNYEFFEAEGRGHFVGVTHSVLQNQGDWWGEGDEMIFIDDRDKPKIIGTGSEDYYLGAWCYGNCGISPFGSIQPTFAYPRYGNPKNGRDNRGARWMVYRFHTDSPIPFNEYFKMTMEHGHGNHRSDNWYTTAYWYQQGEHKLRKPLPAVADRIPRGVNTDGPTMGKP
jgi:D-arabinan exo alpha-(1,3)/(1,5)-arabinofuranosidase (non-reducing end)